jgi:hypothetical protein
MKKIILALAIFTSSASYAQLTVPADGGSKKAMVFERIGLTDVTITYGRPAVNGREGKIWGGLVPAGFTNLGFGTCTECPWRAGANENTVIEFSTPVTIEGQPLRAGKYGLFIAYGKETSTIIFSSATSSWGSYSYDKKEDVLRVAVKPVPLNESRERLTYEFSNETDSSAVISLVWEKLAIPFKVSTQLQQLQLTTFERELRGEKGFDPRSLHQVAEYMLEHNMRLTDALDYATRASQSMPTFGVLMTKSQIEEKLGMKARADSTMKFAISRASMQQLHNYGRTLLRENQKQKAFEIFQANYQQNPNTFMATVGMARGYAAIGKTKEALKYAKMALPLAPDENNKKSVESMVTALKEGKEI